MRLLLDTHTFLWWVKDAPELSRRARAAIADPDNVGLLSLASCWEMAIKLSLGTEDPARTPGAWVCEARPGCRAGAAEEFLPSEAQWPEY